MLIYVKKKKKKNFLRTDRRTDGQPKTIVRNLTKTQKKITKKKTFLRTDSQTDNPKL